VTCISVAKLLMQILETHLNVSGVGMWCAMSAQIIIAPAFPEESFDRYVKLIGQFRESIDGEKCGAINFLCKMPKNFLYKKPDQLENVECFKYLGRMLTNDGRCTCEIKSRIAIAKLHSARKRLFLPQNWT